jgi:DNA invertase Pin-like site-specific DNA recombinase
MEDGNMDNQRNISTAIYLRWSKDDGADAEHNSIKTQRMMLQRYAKENGLVIFDEYVEVYYL